MSLIIVLPNVNVGNILTDLDWRLSCFELVGFLFEIHLLDMFYRSDDDKLLEIMDERAAGEFLKYI